MAQAQSLKTQGTPGTDTKMLLKWVSALQRWNISGDRVPVCTVQVLGIRNKREAEGVMIKLRIIRFQQIFSNSRIPKVQLRKFMILLSICVGHTS